jgi:septum site-determining protein MinC
LIPFALTGTKASHENTANELSLAWVNLKTNSSSKSGSKSVKYDTKIITTPIRSGQQIYAKDANLVVMTQVSAGAEIAADGNIHIFGALRGRAIAGAVGNTDAEIICQDMKAELISIAGTYLVQEDFPDGDGSAHCRLANDSILIEYL